MEKSKSSSATEEEEGLDVATYRTRILKFYRDRFNYEHSIDQAKMECTVTCLGNTHDIDTDKSAPELCLFLKKTEVAEVLALNTVTTHGDGFLDFAKLVDKKLTFSIGSVVNISQNFYLPATSKSQFIHKMWLGYIGSTSHELHTATSSLNGQILLTCQHQVVLVDNMTRRPTRFPDWWKRKYDKFVVGRERHTFAMLGRPPDTLISKVTVVLNDTDENQHTTWLAYPKYCINSLNSPISQGHFKAKRNICSNWIKRLEMFHLGESLEGDNLVVHIWKEDNIDSRIASQIYKGDKCIFQCIIDYHSSLVTCQL